MLQERNYVGDNYEATYCRIYMYVLFYKH